MPYLKIIININQIKKLMKYLTTFAKKKIIQTNQNITAKIIMNYVVQIILQKLKEKEMGNIKIVKFVLQKILKKKKKIN